MLFFPYLANADERAKQDLLNELQVMKSLAKDAHPNVVSLLGCCTLEGTSKWFTSSKPTQQVLEIFSVDRYSFQIPFT